ncbi:glycosyltransferase family 2 protein [Demequina subtropica]|uniref:glycosyltransferase family 2 protein n=1 Tax=Demequina subtropica TaxID=1638989 RepID=UPI000782745C|nr:glycosyltransferase family 2 protein [Demequina subtropica]
MIGISTQRSARPGAGGGPVEEPLISVIVPTYNVAGWIDDLMRSVLRQTHGHLEVIAIDDHSTDGTFETLEHYAAEDPRVRVMRNPGRGGGAARNAGVAEASGAYLAFADGDDIVPHDAYATMLDRLEGSGSDMAVGNFAVFGPSHLRTRSRSVPTYDAPLSHATVGEVPSLLRDRVCWNKLYRADWWRWNGIEFSTSRRSNDIYAGTLAYACAQVEILTEAVYVYRQRVGGSSMTSSKTSAPSMLDHFREERKCAAAVATMSAPAVAYYYENVLRFDSWAHLQGLWAAPEGEPAPEVSEILEIIRGLVDAAPEETFAGLKKAQRWVYRLISGGAVELLRFGQAASVSEFYLLTMTDPDGWDAVDQALGDDAAEFFAYVIQDELPELMLETAQSGDGIEALIEAIAAADCRYGLARRSGPLGGEIIRSAHACHVEDSLALAAVQRRRASIVVTRASATHVELDVLPVDATFVLRHEGGATVAPIAGAAGRLEIDVERLEPGTWRLLATVALSDRVVEYRPRLKSRDTPKVAGDRFRVIEGRHGAIDVEVPREPGTLEVLGRRARRAAGDLRRRLRG